MRSIVIIILVTVILATAPSCAADSKVFSDADLRSYKAPSEDYSNEYNRQIIDRQRSTRANTEQKEQMTREMQELRKQLETDRRERANKPLDKTRRVCRTAPGSFETVCEDETEAESKAKERTPEPSHTPYCIK